MSEILDYVKEVITTNPILVYQDPHKQYYLFMDSSKHVWSGILIQYAEQIKKDGSKLKNPTPSHPGVVLLKDPKRI